jgi:Domain of unknown function (DUF5666)
MRERKRVTSMLAISVIAAALMLAVLATAAQAALRHFDGTVAAKNAAAKTFQITTQGGTKVTLKVNASTVFERIAGGFSGLRQGMQIQVDAAQAKGGLVAKKVEPQTSGGGGEGGGHGGGSDDGPNHT